jgi:adenine phosphoribosyltransferase
VKLLHSLAHIPQFDNQDGEWKPIADSFL